MPRHRVAQHAAEGGHARRESMTPEQRVASAQYAIACRWYTPRGDHLQRIDAHLRALAQIAARAVLRHDDTTLLRVHAVMAPYEKMKMWLDREYRGAIPIEVDDTGKEAASKLEQAEKQWGGVKNAEQVSDIDTGSHRRSDVEGDGGDKP